VQERDLLLNAAAYAHDDTYKDIYSSRAKKLQPDIDKVFESASVLTKGARASELFEDPIIYDQSHQDLVEYLLELLIDSDTVKGQRPRKEGEKAAYTAKIFWKVWNEIKDRLTQDQKEMFKLISTKQRISKAIYEYKNGRSVLERQGIDLEHPVIFEEESKQSW
ncbi:MAG: hypothetical protein HY470_00805, partial [Candidatus Ryanbacteria bacterium]|nr:hypothetical protein [Candidatus Ryanbacteria bacterium]